MNKIKDIHGIVINVGDTIQMPHIKEEGYDIDENGMYQTEVFYNKKRDCLVDENDIGFKFAYGVELIIK